MPTPTQTELLAFEMEIREAILRAAWGFGVPDDLYRDFEQRMLSAIAAGMTAGRKARRIPDGEGWCPEPGWATEMVDYIAPYYRALSPQWAFEPAQGGIA